MEKRNKVKFDKEKIKNKVRANYREIALNKKSVQGCCGNINESEDLSKLILEDIAKNNNKIAQSIGYKVEDIENTPENLNLGLGCGNPIEFAKLKEGETVLDLGSGPGFDAYLAYKEVGDKGKVIGVDMLIEMVERSRKALSNYKSIDIRLGEIENLPVADNSVDCIISNCVINLSLDKQRVYDECFRVLKEGGRLCVSDIININELPKDLLDDEQSYCN